MSETPNIPARPTLPSEMDKMVSLREFEQRMHSFAMSMNDQMRAQRELVETRERALTEARELQAVEYSRRLNELNHSHELAIENWRTSLPREMFDSFEREYQKWRDNAQTQLTQMQVIPPTLTTLDTRIHNIEIMLQQITGALTLIRFMGFAGVLALVVTMFRLLRLVP